MGSVTKNNGLALVVPRVYMRNILVDKTEFKFNVKKRKVELERKGGRKWKEYRRRRRRGGQKDWCGSREGSSQRPSPHTLKINKSEYIYINIFTESIQRRRRGEKKEVRVRELRLEEIDDLIIGPALDMLGAYAIIIR